MDKSVSELLREIYYDPSTGYLGAAGLYKKARERDPSIKRAQVETWLAKQEVAQIHQPRKVTKHYYPIKSNGLDHIWQADLADVSAQAHHNRGVNYLLVVIDIWSRYAWVRALRNKEAPTVNTAFADILAEGRSPQVLETDQGSEFISRSFRALMAKSGIKMTYAPTDDYHITGIVERFIQTLRSRIEKYCTANKTKTYLPVLNELVENYNNTVHSSTGSKPSKPNDKRIEAIIKHREDLAADDLVTLAVGDHVRYLKNKVTFEKGGKPKYSTAVHTVVDALGKRYVLDNGKSYMYYQLKRVPDVEHGNAVLDEAPPEERRAAAF